MHLKKLIALILFFSGPSFGLDYTVPYNIMNQAVGRETLGPGWHVGVDFTGPDVTLNEQQARALAATIPGARAQQDRFFWLALTVQFGSPVRFCYGILEAPNQGPLQTTDISLYEFWGTWAGTLGVMNATDSEWCKSARVPLE